MQASIHFFGAGAPDAGPNTLLLSIDGHRYMFNCGPGTQRTALQHSLKFSHLEAVFFTSLRWEYYGGFKGMVSTLADIHPYSNELKNPQEPRRSHCVVGEENEVKGDNSSSEEKVKEGILPVIGDFGLQRLISGSYSFLKRSIPFLKIVEQDQFSFFKDSIITVRPIFHNPTLKRVSTPSLLEELAIDLETDSEKACKRQKSVNDESSENSVADKQFLIGYLIEGPNVPGKFNVQAALAKGVQPGPDFGALIRGESVKSSLDGSIVNPADVVERGTPFPRIVICEFDDGQLPMHDIGIFFSPHPENESSQTLHRNRKCYYVADNLYPVLIDSYNLEQELNRHAPHFHSALFASAKVPLGNVYPLDEIQLFPERKYLQSTLDIPQSNEVSFPSPSIPMNAVVTLGTGAAMPGKYRNVSATLFLQPDFKCLFDCGEATFGQICRKFGFENARNIIDELDLISISHIHSDHHLGLIQILEQKTSDRKLLVQLPIEILNFVQIYFELHQIPIPAYIFLMENSPGCQVLKNDLFLNIVPVDHCSNSFGFVISHQHSPPLVVYSGDTRPCPELIDAGMNTQLLIHEASMPDNLPEEAVFRKHCTASEAIAVSKQMQAKITILSHLSQRYGRNVPEMGGWEEEGRLVLFASDFLTIPIPHDGENLKIDQQLIKELEMRTAVLNKEANVL